MECASAEDVNREGHENFGKDNMLYIVIKSC